MVLPCYFMKWICNVFSRAAEEIKLICFPKDNMLNKKIAGTPREQSSWGQHGSHLGPVGPRWAPYWPHEPCYQELFRTCVPQAVIYGIDMYLHPESSVGCDYLSMLKISASGTQVLLIFTGIFLFIQKYQSLSGISNILAYHDINWALWNYETHFYF